MTFKYLHVCDFEKFVTSRSRFRRPLVASLATLPTETEEIKFAGYVDIRKYSLNDRMSREEVGCVVSISIILESILVSSSHLHEEFHGITNVRNISLKDFAIDNGDKQKR